MKIIQNSKICFAHQFKIINKNLKKIKRNSNRTLDTQNTKCI